MKHPNTISTATLLAAAVAGALIIGFSRTSSVSATPNGDACQECIIKGCSHKIAACNNECTAQYPPGDSRAQSCVQRCQAGMQQCVKDAGNNECRQFCK
jgi:hypothetical protein